MDQEQVAIVIRDAIRDIPKTYEKNAEQIRRLEEESDDLTHYMELVNLNASEGFQAYKDYQRVRRERRALKDENELLKHLYPIVKGFKNKANQIDSALHGIRKSKRYLKHRTYNCKRRKDLEPVINAKKL